MKKIFLLSLLTLFSCGEKGELKSKFPWSESSLEEALALNTDKIIFLDFYNDNWGGCVKLEAETLSDHKIIDFSNKHLIPIKIDAWDNKEGTEIFNQYDEILSSCKNALCLGARTGQEVVALQERGIDAIGIDLVPCKPYVIVGDIHDLKYEDASYDFMYTNIFDHCFYPEKFCQEITLQMTPLQKWEITVLPHGLQE